MAVDRSRGLWVVLLSLFLALVLSVAALPDSLPAWFAYARPNWVALVVFYWIISLPHRYGVILAWMSGLITDVLLGGLLGQHALAMLIVALIASNLYQRMRMFSIWQQAMIVFIGILVLETIVYLIDLIALGREWRTLYLLSAVVSALTWPWIFLILRYTRRRFSVT